MRKSIAQVTALALLCASFAVAQPAAALGFKKKPSAEALKLNAAALAEIERAINEERFLDAARMIDQATLAGSREPLLLILSGELSLARGRYEAALKTFQQVKADGALQGRATQGEGLALVLSGRTDEAMPVLQKAVSEDANAWRAWNAIGREYDGRRQWSDAEAAYDKALAASGQAAIVLNNRGFSRLLQQRYDEATTDFVAALEKKPDLVAARTNLRLALGLRGDYQRALAGSGSEDKATLLNNAGYAAMLRGDHAEAERMFNEAISLRGQFYARASENLNTSSELKARAQETAKH